MYSFAHLKPLPFTKKLSNIVYSGNGKIFCYITHRNFEYPQILLYNLNKIYPEFDRYSFNNNKEKWLKAKHKGKVCQITPDYYHHPDLRRMESIEEIDKPKKNQVKSKQNFEENVHMEEMKELSESQLYRNLKMVEDRESMNYDSLGEVVKDTQIDTRLYRKYKIM